MKKIIQIGVPDDGTNQSRAIKLLETAGLITVDEKAGYTPEIANITGYKSQPHEKKATGACHPSLSGDDFAEFINLAPGSYAYVGSANAERPETQVSHHNNHFDIDEHAILVATELYAGYALEYLNA